MGHIIPHLYLSIAILGAVSAVGDWFFLVWEKRFPRAKSRCWLYLAVSFMSFMFFLYHQPRFLHLDWILHLAIFAWGLVMFGLINGHHDETALSPVTYGIFQGVVGVGTFFAAIICWVEFAAEYTGVSQLKAFFGTDGTTLFILFLYACCLVFWGIIVILRKLVKGELIPALIFSGLLVASFYHLTRVYWEGEAHFYWALLLLIPIMFRMTYKGVYTAKEVMLLETQKQMLENYGFVRGSIDSSPISSALARAADGKILYLNSHLCSLLGYSEYELIGQNSLHFLDPNFSKRSLILEIEKMGVVSNFDVSVQARGGIVKWLTVSARRVTYLGEECLYICAVDITEIKRLQVNLLHSQERLCEAEAIARLGYWEYILETKEVRWSKQMYILAGKDALFFEPTVVSCLSLVKASDQTRITALFGEVFMDQQERLIDFQIQHDSGEVFYFSAKVGFIQDNDGTRLFGTCVDITNEKMAEREKEEMRMQVLRNEKLASIGELSAGVSHEINNPLAVILGCNEVMMRKIDGEFEEHQLKELLCKQERSILRIRNIIDHMRVMSRSGPQRCDVFNAKEVVIETVSMFDLIYQKENVIIETTAPLENYPVFGDPGRFQQVVMNLISNAKDAIVASCRQNGTILVELAIEDNMVIIRVSDNGVGIKAELLSKIFDTFYTTKPAGKGTGLGLGITRGIIYELKGSVQVRSEEGQGATFEVSLPLQKSAQEISEPISEVLIPPQSQKQGKVLVVDDEEDLREVLQMILEDVGLEVLEAPNGADALKILKQQNIDILMTDMSMPVMTGKELVREVKKLETPPSQVFFISGDLGRGDLLKEYSDDPRLKFGVIEKPFTRDDVVCQLNLEAQNTPTNTLS